LKGIWGGRGDGRVGRESEGNRKVGKGRMVKDPVPKFCQSHLSCDTQWHRHRMMVPKFQLPQLFFTIQTLEVRPTDFSVKPNLSRIFVC
jgi:hypothetical protein